MSVIRDAAYYEDMRRSFDGDDMFSPTAFDPSPVEANAAAMKAMEGNEGEAMKAMTAMKSAAKAAKGADDEPATKAMKARKTLAIFCS